MNYKRKIIALIPARGGSQEIKNKNMFRIKGKPLIYYTIREAKKLVKKYDGEFPDRYFNECLEYIAMTPEEFHTISDGFRSPHLWIKTNNGWKLRHTVNKDGYDD
jgi:hypothetical protein